MFGIMLIKRGIDIMNIANMTSVISSFSPGNVISTNYTRVGPFIYSTMYLAKPTKKQPQSNYSSIVPYKNNHGIYIFTDLNDEIIYVGEASKQTIYKRITNHFNNIEGSLIRKAGITVLNVSQFYLLIDNSTTVNQRNIKFDEALLIGICRPIHNL